MRRPPLPAAIRSLAFVCFLALQPGDLLANERTVQGIVVASDGGAPLAGARVQISGTDRSVYTDDAGRFLIRNLSNEALELEISYVGFEAGSQRVAPGTDTASVTIALGRPPMEEIRVVSQRVAINDALNRYRSVDRISNFVAADDIGQFVDQNVAENLQRLPGIAITRDQGEGRFVSVRGIEAGLSTVTINGMRIGTPEDGSRAVPLDIIPSGSVDLLEINKVPTPDMPGDAIGGSVDVRSGSPFAGREGERFDYRAEMSYNELGEETNPAAGLNFRDVTSVGAGEDNLGVALGINYQKREFESDNLEAVYSLNDDLGDDVLALEEVQLRKYFVDRERLGANLNLEYRADERNRYFVDALYSRFDDAEDRQRSIFVFADGDLVDFDGRSGRYEGIAEDGFRRRIRQRTKEQDTVALSFRGEHLRGDWAFDYYLGHSITRESVPDEKEGRFEKTGEALDATFTQGSGRPSFTFFDGGVADTSYLDNALYVLDRVVVEPIEVDDDDTNFGINAELASAFDVDGLTLKAGLDARLKRKDSNVDIVELRDVPDDVFLDQFTSSAPGFGLGELGPGISADAFIRYYEANRGQFLERPQDVAENRDLSLGDDFEADEDVYAAYLMGTVDRGPWRFIAGLRAERTEYDASGNVIEFDENGDIDVFARSVDTDYTNLMPALHVRYEPRDDLVVRGVWSNTIARPSFSDISPRFRVNLEDQEIDMGNPDLDPYESSNFDLLLDWYPGNQAVVSVGLFYKDIDDYIADVTSFGTGEFDGFEMTRPVNASDASIFGFEANVQQGLEVLSPALAGFLVGANVTLLDTDFEIADRPGESFDLPRAADEAGNLYVGYEGQRLSARLSYSYRGEYLEDIGDSRAFDVYVAESNQLDLVVGYRIADAYEVRFEASNLTDDPLELYQGSSGYVFQFEEYGRTFSLGLTGRF
jgi:TonB-dependent receptor